MRPDDTSPEAWRIMLDVYRKMSPQQRFERTFELSEFVRAACEAGIRSQCPLASDREVFLRLTQRTLGPELFRQVYGDVIPPR
jgi:hypothetical protein